MRINRRYYRQDFHTTMEYREHPNRRTSCNVSRMKLIKSNSSAVLCLVSTCVALWFMLRRSSVHQSKMIAESRLRMVHARLPTQSSVDQSKMIAVNNFVLAESRLRMVHARLPTHTTYATHEHSATFVYDNATHVSCTLYSVIPYRTTFEIVQDLGCAHKRSPPCSAVQLQS